MEKLVYGLKVSKGEKVVYTTNNYVEAAIFGALMDNDKEVPMSKIKDYISEVYELWLKMDADTNDNIFRIADFVAAHYNDIKSKNKYEKIAAYYDWLD